MPGQRMLAPAIEKNRGGPVHPRPPPLERVPTRWNHLVEENALQAYCLSMILSQKWFPLLRIML
jgi:hypothetical protein